MPHTMANWMHACPERFGVDTVGRTDALKHCSISHGLWLAWSVPYGSISEHSLLVYPCMKIAGALVL